MALSNKNTNFDEYISVVPTSAFLGDGIGNLMAHILEQCQRRYAERLAFSEELDCSVMEVLILKKNIYDFFRFVHCRVLAPQLM